MRKRNLETVMIVTMLGRAMVAPEARPVLFFSNAANLRFLRLVVILTAPSIGLRPSDKPSANLQARSSPEGIP